MTFAQLALICAVALLGPLLALPRGFRTPVVIGELLVGILLGRSGFQVLSATDQTFAFLGDIGFALVMFIAGSHVPVRDPAMRAGLRAGAGRASAVGIVALGAGLLLAELFGTGHGLLYAVVIASSSASIVMPALGDIPLTGRSMVAMLPQLALADAMCIVLVPLVIDPGHAPRAAFGAVLVGVAAGIFWFVLRWAERSGRRRRIHELSEERGLALELRSVLVGLFALAALAQSLHVSTMLAGFAAGLAVAGIGEPRRLAQQVFGLTEGFFGPIFFVWLGASLDLRVLGTRPGGIVLGVALGAAAVTVHALAVLTRQPWPVAVSTSAQLGVPVAAAALGSALGLLGPEESAALLLGALLTIVAVSTVSRRVAEIARAEAAATGTTGVTARDIGT